MNRTPKCCHYKSLRPARVILLIAIVSGLPSAVPPCAGQTTAPVQQAADQDCANIKQDIQQLQEDLTTISQEMQRLTQELDQLNQHIANLQAQMNNVVSKGYASETFRGELLDALAKEMSLRKQIKQQLEDDATLMQDIKNEIADLLNKLANCGPPSGTEPPKGTSGVQPLPPSNPPPPPPPSPSPSSPLTPAPIPVAPAEDCEKIKQEIQQLQEDLATISEEMQESDPGT